MITVAKWSQHSEEIGVVPDIMARLPGAIVYAPTVVQSSNGLGEELSSLSDPESGAPASLDRDPHTGDRCDDTWLCQSV